MNTAKILILDDDEEWCDALKKPLISLTDINTDVWVEKDRLKAQVLILKERFNLIILNVRLEYPIDDLSITQRWIELMYFFKESNSEIMVVTSKNYPPSIELYKLIQMAYSDYEVKGFWIKEDFDPKTYRTVVTNVLQNSLRNKVDHLRLVNDRAEQLSFIPNNSGLKLSLSDRQFFVDQLSKRTEWQYNNAHLTRINFLILMGIPTTFTDGLSLEGPYKSTAAMIINKMLQNGDFLVDPEEFTCLGLLMKYLFENCIEANVKLKCANLICENKNYISKDKTWISYVCAWLDSKDSGLED